MKLLNLSMQYFDFHHHKRNIPGIYNLNTGDSPYGNTFSTGIHPQDISEDYQSLFQEVERLATAENCLAIGECGLDAGIAIPGKLQEEVFLKHIDLANRLRKPIIIHCVRRFPEIIAFKKYAAVPMIVHGFNKKKQVAEELLRHGFYLSFGNALLQNVSLQQTFAEIPMEKIFLETDDAETNISSIYKRAAEIRKTSTGELQAEILKNLHSIR